MADVTISQLTKGVPNNGAILPFSQGGITSGVSLNSLFNDTTLIKTTSAGKLASVQFGTSNLNNKKIYFVQKLLVGTGVNGTYNLGDWISIGEISGTGLGWGKEIKIYATHHISDSVNSVTYELHDAYSYSPSTYTGWTAIPSTSNYNYGQKRDWSLEAQIISLGTYAGLRFRYRRLENNTISQSAGTLSLIIEITGGEFTETTSNGNDINVLNGFLGNSFYQFPIRNYEGSWTGFSPSTKGLFITQNGNVGIGTIAPTANLEVVGDVKATNTAKAWVNFYGLGAVGTNMTIRNSYNVDSVYRESNANYVINLKAGVFADANYTITGCSASALNRASWISGPMISTATATSFKIVHCSLIASGNPSYITTDEGGYWISLALFA